jgi:putative zinc finger protein
VDPDEALRHVAAALPSLDDAAASALSLVALAGRARPEVAEATGLSEEDLGMALARGRKALRRSMFALPGSGWCERAERLISDRLDDALEAPGPARLDAHLRNCPRCVEHERRLAQATDALVAAFVEAHPVGSPEPARTVAAAAPPLSVVGRDRPPIAVRPFGDPVQPAPARREAEPAVALRETADTPLLGLPWAALLAVAIVLAVVALIVVVVAVL